jgi:hypothetical protein
MAAFLAGDADANLSFMQHANVVRSVANGQRDGLVLALLDHPHQRRLLQGTHAAGDHHRHVSHRSHKLAV